MTVILSREPEATVAVDDGWEPAPEPSSAALVTHALAQRAASPFEGLRTVLSAVRGPRRVARQTVDVARGFANLRTLLSSNPSSTLNGPIGPHRRWDRARARLVDIKQIRALHGGTINDVVLAAITGGFRELLLSRGETVEGRVLRTLVPVSVRANDVPGPMTTRSLRCSRSCRSSSRIPSSECILCTSRCRISSSRVRRSRRSG